MKPLPNLCIVAKNTGLPEIRHISLSDSHLKMVLQELSDGGSTIWSEN